MKKALLVLLLLAVAGGLFAQEGLSFSSGINAYYRGVRVQENAAGNKVWGTGYDPDNVYAFIALGYENAAGTKGGSIELDVDDIISFDNVYLGEVYGWFTLFDGLLKINGGNWAEGEFNEGYWAVPLWGGGAYGLAAYVYPVENISVGVGLRNEKKANASTDTLEYWFGAALDFDGGGVQTQAMYGVDYGFSAHLSGYYGGDGFSVYGLFRFEGLDEDHNTTIRMNEVAIYTGVQDFRFELPLSQTFYLEEDHHGTGISVGATVYYTPGPWFWPALTLTYANTTYEKEDANHANASTLTINPFARVGLGRTSTYLQLGYVLRLDLLENGAKPRNDIVLNFRWRY